MELSDDDLLRYSRQILLPQIEISGQEKLLRAKVLLFGAGGLGSPIAMYLAASGVGEITIVDPDTVDLSNLQRQIIHQTQDIGTNKVLSAKQTLEEINPNIRIRAINQLLKDEKLAEEVQRADVVVDATDNFASRFAINEVCFNSKTVLITGAAIRFEGQVAIFDMQKNSACYQCLFPKQTDSLQESCSETGILGSVTGLIGCIQATEVVKVLINIGQPIYNKLVLIDALNMEWHSVKINKDPKCATCSG